jgi:hypothetical protein
MRPAKLANQDRRSGRKPMTKPTTISTAETKPIRMPGKERPAASRLVIQGPPAPEPHPRKTGKNTKPSDSQLIRPTAEGLDYRFLRSQPQAIGHGSLRKARPRQSKITVSNALRRLNPKSCKHAMRQGKTMTSSANPLAGFELITYGRF